MTTTSTLIAEWSEPDYNDGDWPYPTEHKVYAIEGDLADEIRAKTGLEGQVTSVEEVISGGYSEYTQENDYPFEIHVGDVKVFEYDCGSPLGEEIGWKNEFPQYGFTTFNNWLNEEEK